MAALSSSKLFICLLIIFASVGNMAPNVKGQQRCREVIGKCDASCNLECCFVKCNQEYYGRNPQAICESRPLTAPWNCTCTFNCGR
nr:hypothetical protein POPTR_001G180750 [Ipomoea trifida]